MLSLLIPKNIQIEWGSNFIQVSGPLGSIRKKKVEFLLAKENSRLFLSVNDSNENNNIEHFYLSMIKSYIIGVSKGYRKKLRLVGVGYKAHVNLTNTLVLKIGYNHEVLFPIPEDIKIICSKVKGTVFIIQGTDKYRVNQIAAQIKLLRKPDVYKGKGIHYDKEILTLKKGKRENK